MKAANITLINDVFYINRRSLQLTRSQYVILKLLFKNYKKKITSLSSIIEALYYSGDEIRDEPLPGTVKVFLWQLRKKLSLCSDNKLSIKNYSGMGWYIEEEKPNLKHYYTYNLKPAREGIFDLKNLGQSIYSISKISASYTFNNTIIKEEK